MCVSEWKQERWLIFVTGFGLFILIEGIQKIFSTLIAMINNSCYAVIMFPEGQITSNFIMEQKKLDYGMKDSSLFQWLSY